jgi:hypothetical protein
MTSILENILQVLLAGSKEKEVSGLDKEAVITNSNKLPPDVASSEVR